MRTTVFFSWQSDRPAREGRNFIERALSAAIGRIAQDLQLDESIRGQLRLDKDTQDVPGSPEIFNTILKKIESAGIFVADLTFVGTAPDGTPTPNPNVLIEYGYALKSLGDSRIVAVMNTAYGPPSRLPFDLVSKRFPIDYKVEEGALDSVRREARQDLAKTLESALRLILGSDEYQASILKKSDTTAATYREPKDGRARFRAKGKPIGYNRSFPAELMGQQASPVYLADGPSMWLRVAPQASLERSRKVTDLESSMNALAVLSLCAGSASPLSVRGNDGCGFCRITDQDASPSVTYIFTDGEIWAINTFFLQFYPALILLEDLRFAESLTQCAEHLTKISIPGPYRWVAGLEGVEGRYLPSRQGVGRGPGPCTEDVIEVTGAYRLGEGAADALQPFFEELYDKCGAKWLPSSAK